MTTQRNAGPNRMRLWADYIEQNVKHHLLPLAVKNPDTLRELAAQWDADRAEAQEIRQLGMRYMVDLASMTARAERAEAVLEQVQNALLVRDHQYQATKAALERARALLADIQWDGNSDGTLCPACNRFELDGHRPGCKLAALLATGSGGAA